MTGFDDLPPELVYQIFARLDNLQDVDSLARSGRYCWHLFQARRQHIVDRLLETAPAYSHSLAVIRVLHGQVHHDPRRRMPLRLLHNFLVSEIFVPPQPRNNRALLNNLPIRPAAAPQPSAPPPSPTAIFPPISEHIPQYYERQSHDWEVLRNYNWLPRAPSQPQQGLLEAGPSASANPVQDEDPFYAPVTASSQIVATHHAESIGQVAYSTVSHHPGTGAQSSYHYGIKAQSSHHHGTAPQPPHHHGAGAQSSQHHGATAQSSHHYGAAAQSSHHHGAVAQSSHGHGTGAQSSGHHDTTAQSSHHHGTEHHSSRHHGTEHHSSRHRGTAAQSSRYHDTTAQPSHRRGTENQSSRHHGTEYHSSRHHGTEVQSSRSRHPAPVGQTADPTLPNPYGTRLRSSRSRGNLPQPPHHDGTERPSSRSHHVEPFHGNLPASQPHDGTERPSSRSHHIEPFHGNLPPSQQHDATRLRSSRSRGNLPQPHPHDGTERPSSRSHRTEPFHETTPSAPSRRRGTARTTPFSAPQPQRYPDLHDHADAPTPWATDPVTHVSEPPQTPSLVRTHLDQGAHSISGRGPVTNEADASPGGSPLLPSWSLWPPVPRYLPNTPSRAPRTRDARLATRLETAAARPIEPSYTAMAWSDTPPPSASRRATPVPPNFSIPYVHPPRARPAQRQARSGGTRSGNSARSVGNQSAIPNLDLGPPVFEPLAMHQFPPPPPLQEPEPQPASPSCLTLPWRKLSLSFSRKKSNTM